MWLPAVTLFLASALLFLVEPMTARQVLPLLGGTPAVWTTCMLFFQLALLAGYAYAHRAPARLGQKLSAVHLVVLMLALVPLCVPIPAFWTGMTGSAPVTGLLLMLAATIGLPFFVLATTAPLVQRQLAASGRAGERGPWWLYAASNAGSFVGLCAYPTLVEPTLSLGEQRTLWTVGYAVVAFGTALCLLANRTPAAGAATAPTAPAGTAAAAPVPGSRVALWVLLAFAPSSLLLGVTAHLSTNLAPVPLLWVVPLALYLATFVIAFARPAPVPGRRPRRTLLPGWLPPILRWTESEHKATTLLPVLLLPLLVLFWWERAEHAPVLLLLHLGAFFLAALACHGRLADLRPAPEHLTAYYLWLAFGGALGGIWNGLVAPFVFQAPIEYPLLLVGVCLLLPGPPRTRADVPWGLGIAALALAAVVLPEATVLALTKSLVAALVPAAVLALLVADRPVRLCLGAAGILAAGGLLDSRTNEVVHRDRSIFGAHYVERLPQHAICLVHGNILHGAQVQEEAERREPLTYFHRTGPCGEIFTALAGRIPNGRVGAVGLGVGSIAAYGQPGEKWTFFELDAAVERTARGWFTYLADCRAQVDVRIGDGRLLLDATLDGEFGLILLDAFNSDAIPVHLLTREAVAIYLKKLAPGGVIAVHVSSRYVDLPPVVGDLAADAGLVARWLEERDLPAEALDALQRESTWVVMARQKADLAGLPWADLPPRRPPVVWTDERSSLLGALKFAR